MARYYAMTIFPFPQRKQIRTAIWSSSYSTPPQVVKYDRSKTFQWSKSGVTLPGWKDLIKRHENATTSFVAEKFEVSDIPGLLMATCYSTPLKKSYQVIVEGQILDAALSGSAGVSYSSADSLALMHFLRKIRQSQTEMAGGSFLGELRETVQMIRHPMNSLRRAFADYFSAVGHRFRGVRRAERYKQSVLERRTRIVADLWLEFSFGLRPLLKDIDDAVAAYESLLAVESYKRISGIGESDSGSVGSTVRTSFDSGLWWFQTTKSRQFASVKYYGEVFHRAEHENPEAFARHFGLTVSEFLPTVYELFPFSWLADYFSNLGDIVSAYTMSLAGLKWHGRSILRTNRNMVFGLVDAETTKASFGSEYRYCSGTAGVASFESSRINRDIPILGVPEFAFRFPGLVTQGVNIGAVILQGKNVQKLILGR